MCPKITFYTRAERQITLLCSIISSFARRVGIHTKLYTAFRQHHQHRPHLRSMLRLKNNFLHLHLVEDVISLNRLAHRHNSACHETISCQLSPFSRSHTFHPTNEGGNKKDHSLQQMLLLLQHLQRLRENTPNRTPPHLYPQILPISLITRPRNLLIMDAKTRNIAPRSQQIKASFQRISMSNTFNNRICSSAVC